MKTHRGVVPAGVAFALIGSLSSAPAQTLADRITISVDARTPWKNRIPVSMKMRAVEGRLTLVFPRWLPGMHAMEGPLGNFARITVNADGTALPWERDPFDPYLIQVDVPKGAKIVEAAYDYVPAKSRSNEVFFGVAADEKIAVLNPAAFSLAPVGDPRTLMASFTMRLPRGWTAATALSASMGASPDGGTLTVPAVSLYTLVDSPIMAGAHHKSIPVAAPGGDVPHALELFAESEDVLTAKAPVVTPLVTRLVAESGKLFGARHYRSFKFLLALTNEIGRNGLEHHEGVAYVLQPDDLDANKSMSPMSSWNAMLIPHEFTHSWNGKYRRPYGQDVHSSIAPQSADLIWVYEGLTEWLGDVLMVRAGFRPAEAFRRDLLGRIATMRMGQGRDWQSVADIALAAPYTYVHGSGTSLRGMSDVYYESELSWLEADAIIRRESGGKRSLDDFCRLFFGGPNKGAEVITYTRKDVIDALERTQPHNWAAFIQDRFYKSPKTMPTEGVEAAGWKVTFVEKPESPIPGFTDYRFSVGAGISQTGKVIGVLEGSAAECAGLEDGMSILGVNGQVFSPQVLQEGVRGTKGRKPIELLVADDKRYKTVKLEGLDGERYPTLIRDQAHPDLLSLILAPTVAVKP